MKYTVLFAHFKTVYVKKGQTLTLGNKIGIEGTTGISTGRHCHIAVAEGEISDLNKMRLTPLTTGATKSSKVQCEAMLTKYLYNTTYFVTTPYLDPNYERQFGLKHPAIDVSASKNGAYIQWSRTQKGVVLNVYYNDTGYGNCVLVAFETTSSTSGTIGSTTSNKLKVGDTVTIEKSGNASSTGSGSTAGGIGWSRQVLQVLNGVKFPYRVGDSTGTTGYYQQEALVKTKSSQQTVYYIVKRNDTLTSIAKKFNTTVKDLIAYNKIKNPNLIFIGQKLKVIK